MTLPFTHAHYTQELAHLYEEALGLKNLPLAVKIAQLRFDIAVKESDHHHTTVKDVFATIQAMNPDDLVQLCTLMESLMTPSTEESSLRNAPINASGVGVSG